MSRLETLDERTTWLSTAARALAPDGAVILTHASTLPRNLPDDLRVLAQVPPEPVQASNAVVLTPTVRDSRRPPRHSSRSLVISAGAL